jgi:hypothetical protein
MDAIVNDKANWLLKLPGTCAQPRSRNGEKVV